MGKWVVQLLQGLLVFCGLRVAQPARTAHDHDQPSGLMEQGWGIRLHTNFPGRPITLAKQRHSALAVPAPRAPVAPLLVAGLARGERGSGRRREPFGPGDGDGGGGGSAEESSGRAPACQVFRCGAGSVARRGRRSARRRTGGSCRRPPTAPIPPPSKPSVGNCRAAEMRPSANVARSVGAALEQRSQQRCLLSPPGGALLAWRSPSPSRQQGRMLGPSPAFCQAPCGHPAGSLGGAPSGPASQHVGGATALYQYLQSSCCRMHSPMAMLCTNLCRGPRSRLGAASRATLRRGAAWYSTGPAFQRRAPHADFFLLGGGGSSHDVLPQRCWGRRVCGRGRAWPCGHMRRTALAPTWFWARWVVLTRH